MQSLFDVVKKETEEAIDQSYHYSNPEWRRITIENLKRFCECTPTFTMNEFREYNKLFCKIETHDNRAMGGIIRTALKDRWIKPTGKSILSRVGHKSLLQVWKSNLLRNDQEAI